MINEEFVGSRGFFGIILNGMRFTLPARQWEERPWVACFVVAEADHLLNSAGER